MSKACGNDFFKDELEEDEEEEDDEDEDDEDEDDEDEEDEDEDEDSDSDEEDSLLVEQKKPKQQAIAINNETFAYAATSANYSGNMFAGSVNSLVGEQGKLKMNQMQQQAPQTQSEQHFFVGSVGSSLSFMNRRASHQTPINSRKHARTNNNSGNLALQLFVLSCSYRMR